MLSEELWLRLRIDPGGRNFRSERSEKFANAPHRSHAAGSRPFINMHTILSLNEGQHDVVLQTEALTVLFDSNTRTLRANMHASPRPCMTEVLLRDLHDLHVRLSRREIEADFYVLGSGVPNVFNLGGDLNLFRACALQQDWERLTEYATRCIDTLNHAVLGFGQQTITIAMIQGDALGGGLEAALATDFMVAEEHSRLGFPEVLFNLFPGMGAYTFLSRKIGPQPAQRMILSGAMYGAVELREKGVVDLIAPTGQGQQVVDDFIRDTRKHLRGYKAFLHARRRATFWPGRDELMAIVTDWVEAVKLIGERDLRMMDKIVLAQTRLKALAA